MTNKNRFLESSQLYPIELNISIRSSFSCSWDEELVNTTEIFIRRSRVERYSSSCENRLRISARRLSDELENECFNVPGVLRVRLGNEKR